MIRHVMKDGTRKESIEGFTVSADQASAVYDLINMIERKEERNVAWNRSDGKRISDVDRRTEVETS